MTCAYQVTVQPPPQVAMTVQPPPSVTLTLAVGQGPAGVGNGSGLAPLAVSSSRDIASTDAGRVLQCAHGITLTLPADLPAALALQLLMNATQVQAGGILTVTPGAGVTINGYAESSWRIERTVGSAAPWMAWLQHETGSNAYSLLAIGADLTEIIATSSVYESGIYESGVYA